MAAPRDEELTRGSQAALTRRDLVRKAGVGAFALTMFGGLADKAFPFYGPLRYKHKQLSGELKILQWAHFVPDYDKWLDNTYIKQWGEKNDVEVKIDHINNALLFSTASSQVAAQSGHDLFQFLSPPSSFQKQVIPVDDIIQEVTRKLGKMTDVGYRSTYNPKTKHYFGFPDNYVPDPIHYRRSLWFNAGIGPKTWEDVRKAAPILKRAGHPVGLGMSNEIDSNMFLFALLYCYGGFVQNAENRIVFNQGANRRGAIEALKLMRDIFRDGMSDEVFAWTAASNNQGFLAGRLSLAVNAISIARAAEATNPDLADDTWLAPIPRGPFMRMGNEHVMGVYVIWKFAKNKEAAKKFLVDQQLGYKEHFLQSKFYNFPVWTNAIKGGFDAIRKIAAQDTHKPLGKYTILTTIAQKYTTNVGFPGFSNAVIDEIFNRYLIPQMFAQVAQGKMSPEDAVSAADKEFRNIHRKWRNQGLV
ncbi:MAG: sugar ABC transporter substrate-binding protein [Thermoleophilia bacterium]